MSSATNTESEELSSVLQRGIGTVLVCDLSDISQSAISMRPEELIQRLNRLFETQVPILRRHSALILSQSGDAIRAVWTPDHVNPSHAQLAFVTGCEIIAELRRDSGFSIQIAIGTGEMVLAQSGGTKSQSLQVVGQANLIAENIHAERIPNQGSSLLLTPLTAKILTTNDRTFELVGKLSQADGSNLDILRFVVP